MTHYVVMAMTPEEIKTNVQERAVKFKLDWYQQQNIPADLGRIDVGANTLYLDQNGDEVLCSVYIGDVCSFLDYIKSEKDIKQAFIHLFELNEAE